MTDIPATSGVFVATWMVNDLILEFHTEHVLSQTTASYQLKLSLPRNSP